MTLGLPGLVAVAHRAGRIHESVLVNDPVGDKSSCKRTNIAINIQSVSMSYELLAADAYTVALICGTLFYHFTNAASSIIISRNSGCMLGSLQFII